MSSLNSLLHWLRPRILARHRRPVPGRPRLETEELEPRLLLSTYRSDFGPTESLQAKGYLGVPSIAYSPMLTVTDTAGRQAVAATAATVSAASPGHVWLATSGIYWIGPENSVVGQGVLSNPYVNGVLLRATWDQLEPADGVYDWSYLDGQIAAAAAAKQVALSILPGIHTPSWVYADGAAAFHFVTSKSPAVQVLPVPWDPVFLGKWQAFVQALGARYGANPALTHVKITGVNTIGEETWLPVCQGGSASNGTTTWTTTNDVADWQAIGYTRTRVKQAWLAIADGFARAFPAKQIALLTVPKAFPPIDAHGRLIAGYTYDPQASQDLVNQGIARYGSQLIVQNDGLSDFWIDPHVKGVANQVTTGYQMLWFSTGDSTYRMNGGIAIGVHDELQTAVKQALASGARFLEIYNVDVLNAGLQDILAAAQPTLRGRPPTVTITGAPASGHSPEGTAISLGNTVADPLSANPSGLMYAWSVTKNGAAFATGSGPGFTFRPDDNGTYVVSLRVTDAGGRVSTPSTTTIAVDNVAPTVSLGGPYTGSAGTPIAFAATVTDPSQVDAAAGFTYLWNFGDGATSALSAPRHTYTAGVYLVTLTVTDKDGGRTTVTTRVTVT